MLQARGSCPCASSWERGGKEARDDRPAGCGESAARMGGTNCHAVSCGRLAVISPDVLNTLASMWEKKHHGRGGTILPRVRKPVTARLVTRPRVPCMAHPPSRIHPRIHPRISPPSMCYTCLHTG